jgi:hypothetical protein
MINADILLPSMTELDRRLAENQHDRYLLRALQRLAIRARRWRTETETTTAPTPDAGRQQNGGR